MSDKISPSFAAYRAGADQIEALVLLAPSESAKGKQQKLEAAVTARDSFMAEVRAQLRSSTLPPPQPRNLPVACLKLTREELQAVAARHDVVAIVPNQRVRLIEPLRASRGGPSDPITPPSGEMTWNLEALEIPGLWQDAGNKGGGSRVGVIDTGVHAEHPALAGRIERAILVDPLGRKIMPDPMFDAGEHGTHVCGVIAGGAMPNGAAIGVAPEAKLQVAGALLGEARLSAVMAAMSWAVERRCRILNLSLGFTYYEPLFEEILARIADDFEVITVAAVGNDSHGSSRCPGNVEPALSVGAVGRSVDGESLDVAPFSSGATLTFPADPGEAARNVVKPDLVAPGVEVLSCVPPRVMPWGTVEYAAMDGTSMAAPHVAGVMAILMAAVPRAQPQRLVEALRETSWHPQGRRPDNRWGWGLIRPREALRALRS